MINHYWKDVTQYLGNQKEIDFHQLRIFSPLRKKREYWNECKYYLNLGYYQPS